MFDDVKKGEKLNKKIGEIKQKWWAIKQRAIKQKAIQQKQNHKWWAIKEKAIHQKQN